MYCFTIKQKLVQMRVTLKKNSQGPKKYTVILRYDDGKTKTVQFGAAGMSDYTKHKDASRKKNYVSRHAARENWSKSGIATAGFWSRWLLWNQTTLSASKRDIARRFGVTFSAR